MATLTVTGDVGKCGSPGVAQTAALVSRFNDDLVLLGDLAYPNGTAADFAQCFDPGLRVDSGPASGRCRGTTSTTCAGADGYFTYFGGAAGPGRLGYYAFRAGGWQVLMLNSSVPIDRGSAQDQWVRDQLQAQPRCSMAAVHHPFDSSGPHGGTPGLRDVWQLLYEAGVEVMLNGHEHAYERLVPQDADRRADPGPRHPAVHRRHRWRAPVYPRARQAANSEVYMRVVGVLRLALQPTQYEWEFLDVSGGVRDGGGASCH